MFEDETDPYDIEVEPDEFCTVVEEAADEYAAVLEDNGVDEHDVEVVVTETVEERPERFHPFSTRIQDPLVVVEYEMEYGRQTFRTRDWASYRDRDRDEALAEAELDLPDPATVERA